MYAKVKAQFIGHIAKCIAKTRVEPANLTNRIDNHEILVAPVMQFAGLNMALLDAGTYCQTQLTSSLAADRPSKWILNNLNKIQQSWLRTFADIVDLQLFKQVIHIQPQSFKKKIE